MMHLFNIPMNRVVLARKPEIFHTKPTERDRDGQHVLKKIAIRKLRTGFIKRVSCTICIRLGV